VNPGTTICFALLAVAAACDAPGPAASAPPQAASTSARVASTGASAVPPPSGTTSAAPPVATIELRPDEGPYVALAVAGHPSAIVSVPAPSARARPLIVATHGNFDRPEWQCEVFRGIAGPDAFILCPRGEQRPDSPSASDVRFTYASNQRLESELHAGLVALRQRYGGELAGGPAIYAGFSLGAIMGVAILTRNATKGAFDRALFVEGGYDRIDAGKARALFDAGVTRVLFACGQAACLQGARAKLPALQKAGVEGRVVGVGRAGHSYDGAVADAVKAEWEWLSARLDPAR
jgi:hypothetical protein